MGRRSALLGTTFLGGVLTLLLYSFFSVQREGELTLSHRSLVNDVTYFDQAFESAADVPPMTERVYGMVLPHHLVAKDHIARILHSIRKQNPSVVAVIGPNHFRVGQGGVLMTDLPYDTPFGFLSADAPSIALLFKDGIARVDHDPFYREHSISALAPFIKHTFPDARVLPIILKEDVSQAHARLLGETLANVLPEDALVIASVDFSHYLPLSVANYHDALSLSVLRNASEEELRFLEVDSTASLSVLLSYLHKRNAQHMVYEDHTNSAVLAATPLAPETTSHFFFGFGKGNAEQNLGISLLAFGDAIFDRGIAQLMEHGGNDRILAALRGKENRFFRGMSLVHLNLEGPLTEDKPVSQDAVRFGFSPKSSLRLLKSMQVSLINLANNHTDDAGERGREETVHFLRGSNISTSGYPFPCTRRQLPSGTLSMCGFDDSDERLDLDVALDLIRAEASKSDRTVVSIHWGKEYAAHPTNRQREIAAKIVDAGADAVIGHHPHIVQDVEIIGHSPVFYSLGNFIFDQPDAALSSGMAVGIFFAKHETEVFLFPMSTTSGQPHLLPLSQWDAHLRRHVSSSNTEEPWRLRIPRDS